MPPRRLPRLLRRLLPLALLLALPGCMGRWQLDDLTAWLRSPAEVPPGRACSAGAQPPYGDLLPTVGTPSPGAAR